MEEFVLKQVSGLAIPFLLGIILVSLLVLGKGADILVDEAVVLSYKWGIPKMVIGATIVSLGTTLPEVSVSVLASIYGNPGVALGNAVGSIICDTGLILGIAVLISPPILEKKLLNRQGWIQFASGILLVLATLPFSNLSSVWTQGGNLPQFVGFGFLGLLAVYIYTSFIWSREKSPSNSSADTNEGVEIDEEELRSHPVWILAKLFFGVFVVIFSSQILIPTVQVTALKLSIPESIIGATLVAFGTSLPELITAISAARKGHSELAVGNIIGADVLNVLFVAGASAAVTKQGLDAPPEFFFTYFPAMIAVLVVFRLGIFLSPERMGRPFGFVLVLIYFLITAWSYLSI